MKDVCKIDAARRAQLQEQNKIVDEALAAKEAEVEKAQAATMRQFELVKESTEAEKQLGRSLASHGFVSIFEFGQWFSQIADSTFKFPASQLQFRSHETCKVSPRIVAMNNWSDAWGALSAFALILLDSWSHSRLQDHK